MNGSMLGAAAGARADARGAEPRADDLVRASPWEPPSALQPAARWRNSALPLENLTPQCSQVRGFEHLANIERRISCRLRQRLGVPDDRGGRNVMREPVLVTERRRRVELPELDDTLLQSESSSESNTS